MASRWKNHVLEVGISAWNPIDTFNKAEAKAWAALRMMGLKPGGRKLPEGMLAGKNIKHEIMECIAADTSQSTRVRSAAKLWLSEFEIRTAVNRFGQAVEAMLGLLGMGSVGF